MSPPSGSGPRDPTTLSTLYSCPVPQQTAAELSCNQLSNLCVWLQRFDGISPQQSIQDTPSVHLYLLEAPVEVPGLPKQKEQIGRDARILLRVATGDPPPSGMAGIISRRVDGSWKTRTASTSRSKTLNTFTWFLLTSKSATGPARWLCEETCCPPTLTTRVQSQGPTLAC